MYEDSLPLKQSSVNDTSLEKNINHSKNKTFKNEAKEVKRIIKLTIIIICFVALVSIKNYKENYIYTELKKSPDKHFNDKTTFFIAAAVKDLVKIKKLFFPEMKKLVKMLGTKNVIVSIIENGDSKDGTKYKLIDLQKFLDKNKVRNKIYIDHIIDKPKDFWKNFDYFAYLRIIFYADLKNKCMDYLYEIPNLDFDNTYILFFNDIAFKADDAIRLLKTNNGEYDAACGLDFQYKGFYDEWACCDYNGYSPKGFTPYFHDEEDKKAVLNGDPVRVFTCWNGLIVYNAKNFKDRQKTKFRYTTMETRKKITAKRFGSYNPGYECECTNMNIDLYTLGHRMILVNPNVRVAYNIEEYKKFKYKNEIIKNETLSKINLLKLKEEPKMSQLMEKWYLENKIDLQ